MSQVERITVLQPTPINLNKQYIAYWCYKSLRVRYNHALEYAIHLANKHTLPLVVFTTSDTSPNTSWHSMRHLMFDLQAKQHLANKLQESDLQCIHLFGNPPAIAAYMANEAASLVIDKPYLGKERAAVHSLVQWAKCAIIQVESNVVVPIDAVSSKLEYAAYTIRPKITKQLDQFLLPLTHLSVETPSIRFSHPHLVFPAYIYLPSTKIQHIHAIDNSTICTQQFVHNTFASIDHSIKPIAIYGGEDAAQDALADFLQNRIVQYDKQRNDPSNNECEGFTSHLSHFLRVGALSPVDIALQTSEQVAKLLLSLNEEDKILLQESHKTFFEELIVRRELAYNFVFHNDHYVEYSGIPSWAESTLEAHREDARTITYSLERMEHASTEDHYWNAAQNQLTSTGIMHGYMRMYWGKKILEWCEIPKEAFDFTIAQNDKYALDAPDPNGYAGISWCYGTHDRPHPERPIFGKLRYMNAAGLARKFNIEAYARHWN